MRDKIMDSETIKVLNVGMVGVISTYCELLNPVITVLIGIASFAYVCSKVYWFNKNKGK